MSLRAVIFDFGGVLVRTRSQESRRAWEQRLGLRPGEAENIVFGGENRWAVQLGAISDEDHWRWLGQRLRLEPEVLQQFRLDFFASDELDTDLLAYVDRLRSGGYHLGLLSNASDVARAAFRERYPLLEHFDSVTISAEEHVMKPDPLIFEIALNRAGTRAVETVIVDDNLPNIEAANRLGFATVHFRDPQAARAKLAELTGVS